jgi:hypothetical protein
MNIAQPTNAEPNVPPLIPLAFKPHTTIPLAIIVIKPAKLGTIFRPNYNLTPQCQILSSDATKIADQTNPPVPPTIHNTCAKPTVEVSLPLN